MNNYFIVNADINNVGDIAKIENDCDKDKYSIRLIEQSLNSENIHNYIIMIDDNSIGYISFSTVLDECEILKIVVCKEYRKQGYAYALMQDMLSKCKNFDTKTIYLEVRCSNVPAIKLYEKCGFKLITKREKYYQDGEDALVYGYKI